MNKLPGDIIRYIASYGVDVVRLLSFCCKQLHNLLKEEIPRLYGHLPVSRGEVIEYVMNIIHDIDNDVHKKVKRVNISARALGGHTHDPIRMKIGYGPAHPLSITCMAYLNGIFQVKGHRKRTFAFPLSKSDLECIHDDISFTINGLHSKKQLYWDLDLTMWVYQQRQKRCRYFGSNNPTYPLQMTMSHLHKSITGIMGAEDVGYSFREMMRSSSTNGIPTFDKLQTIDRNSDMVSRVLYYIKGVFTPSTKRKIVARIKKEYKAVPGAVLPQSGSIEAALLMVWFFIRVSLEEGTKKKNK
jgi:hypothetical protein